MCQVRAQEKKYDRNNLECVQVRVGLYKWDLVRDQLRFFVSWHFLRFSYRRQQVSFRYGIERIRHRSVICQSSLVDLWYLVFKNVYLFARFSEGKDCWCWSKPSARSVKRGALLAARSQSNYWSVPAINSGSSGAENFRITLRYIWPALELWKIYIRRWWSSRGERLPQFLRVYTHFKKSRLVLSRNTLLR